MPDVTCADCGKVRRHRARGKCGPCYDRLRHAGQLEDVRRKWTFDEWLALIDQSANGCWLWPGPTDALGYGRYGGRSHVAHRRVYELFVGPIPDGFHLDHLCRTPRCVRPDHLEAVPPAVNILRGVGAFAINGRKVKCKRGHSLTDPVNVRITKAGYRSCIQCNKDRCAAWYEVKMGRSHPSSS